MSGEPRLGWKRAERAGGLGGARQRREIDVIKPHGNAVGKKSQKDIGGVGGLKIDVLCVL